MTNDRITSQMGSKKRASVTIPSATGVLAERTANGNPQNNPKNRTMSVGQATRPKKTHFAEDIDQLETERKRKREERLARFGASISARMDDPRGKSPGPPSASRKRGMGKRSSDVTAIIHAVLLFCFVSLSRSLFVSHPPPIYPS